MGKPSREITHGHFPLKIQYQKTGQVVIVKSAEEISSSDCFTVLATMVRETEDNEKPGA